MTGILHFPKGVICRSDNVHCSCLNNTEHVLNGINKRSDIMVSVSNEHSMNEINKI